MSTKIRVLLEQNVNRSKIGGLGYRYFYQSITRVECKSRQQETMNVVNREIRVLLEQNVNLYYF